MCNINGINDTSDIVVNVASCGSRGAYATLILDDTFLQWLKNYSKNKKNNNVYCFNNIV